MLGLIATVFYGLLSIGGGIMGFKKSQSKVSLISGGISGVLLLVTAAMMNVGQTWASSAAIAIIALLIVVFIARWFKTKKLMPALPMVLFGGIAIALNLV